LTIYCKKSSTDMYNEIKDWQIQLLNPNRSFGEAKGETAYASDIM